LRPRPRSSRRHRGVLASPHSSGYPASPMRRVSMWARRVIGWPCRGIRRASLCGSSAR
jgi:hypothetical protein